MATTRRNLLTTALATAVVPTLALAAAASTAPHPIFAAMEAHSAAWHQLDDACTKAGLLFKSPDTTTVAVLRAADAERDAIGESLHRPAYESLVAIAIAGVPHDAVMPLLAHIHNFELVEFLDLEESQAFLSAVASAATKV
jgi:hypothetical protein